MLLNIEYNDVDMDLYVSRSIRNEEGGGIPLETAQINSLHGGGWKSLVMKWRGRGWGGGWFIKYGSCSRFFSFLPSVQVDTPASTNVCAL